METSENTNSPDRNYNSITPSAQSLLVMKGLTDIPFAKEAASLMLHPAKYDPDTSNKDALFWARLVHFESRYWSINQLLAGLPVKNILELSSGFSFRGLQMIQENDVHYIDTDLSDFIEIKKKFVQALQPKTGNIPGKLETLPLNALDEKQFDEVINHFPDGEIAIINEGLLMYLGVQEKEKLLNIIQRVLKQRGGYWITADIYIRQPFEHSVFKPDENARKFFDQHRIDENKFTSFEQAEQFFTNAGFIIDKVAEPDRSKLSSLKYLIDNVAQEELDNMRKAGTHRATWRLKVV